MSAVAFAPVDAPARQRHLFEADPDGERRTASVTTVRPAAAAVPTLAALVSERWAAISSGAVADCLACGSAMEPRWSAGQGIVGARCRACGTSLD